MIIAAIPGAVFVSAAAQFANVTTVLPSTVAPPPDPLPHPAAAMMPTTAATEFRISIPHLKVV
ncbi:MAG: hypothetical protein ACRDNF_20235 [Streptosporangiaceae bacterium]